jgi:enoyl-CoA hydratase/carnithine racemase
LDATVDALAQSLLAGAPLALRGMKLSLNEIARGAWQPEQLRLRERGCAESADLQEGLAAFAARRSPRFEGR